jgi:hypothetical protein
MLPPDFKEKQHVPMSYPGPAFVSDAEAVPVSNPDPYKNFTPNEVQI